MNRFLLTAIVMGIIPPAGLAQSVCVFQDNGSIPSSAWEYDVNNNLIRIETNQGDFVFQFRIEDCSGNPATINGIVSYLDESVSGQKIRLQVGDVANAGAVDIGRIRLEPTDPQEGDNVDTEIVGLNITGNFLALQSGTMVVDLVSGDISVAGNIEDALTIQTALASDFTVGGNVNGDIVIQGDLSGTATIDIGTDLAANLTLEGGLDAGAQIIIGRDLTGSRKLLVNSGRSDTENIAGTITVTQDLRGTIETYDNGLSNHLGGDVTGSIDIEGNISPDGRIIVNNVPGAVRVHGGILVNGQPDFLSISARNLTGTIEVNYDQEDGNNLERRIRVVEVGNGGALTIRAGSSSGGDVSGRIEILNRVNAGGTITMERGPQGHCDPRPGGASPCRSISA